MRSDEFEYLAGLVRQRSGLVLTPDKAYLLESRLMPLSRKAGFKDLSAMIADVRSKRTETLIRAIVEAMTTNESLFFRDRKPFELLEQVVLPSLMELRKNERKLRIWSAACSSGQEPYSIAMMLKEASARFAGWRIEIMATDISCEMLDKAKAGVYSQFEVQRGLPITLLVKYFKQQGDRWTLDGAIRSAVNFREFNLLQDPAALGRFDVVFCRNVLIYFDLATKKKVLDGIARQLTPEGILYLGGAETVLGVTDRFRPVAGQRGLYQRSDGEPLRMSA